jgi:DNA-binding SARP family transcriptional activator
MNAVSPQATSDAARRPEPRSWADTDLQPLWNVGLLGGLSLSDGSQHITRLPSRAVTALLARLALAPERAHAREELIELLWPGVALAVGRNRLRQALSTLKGILEPAGRLPPQPVLQADRISVRVVPGSLGCDATRFERALRAGRFDAARALYRGELLPGYYDDWIDEERMRLGALHERLLTTPETPADPRPETPNTRVR